MKWTTAGWSQLWGLIVWPHKLWFIHAVKFLRLIAFYYSWSSFFYLQGVDYSGLWAPAMVYPSSSELMCLTPAYFSEQICSIQRTVQQCFLHLELLCLTSLREWPPDTFPAPRVGPKSSSPVTQQSSLQCELLPLLLQSWEERVCGAQHGVQMARLQSDRRSAQWGI